MTGVQTCALPIYPIPSIPFVYVVVDQSVQPLWKTVCKFLRKLKIELTYDPAIPLLGIYSEKTLIRKDTCAPMFTVALFTIVRT